MFDVVVVGGGPVGACLGALLAGAPGGARTLSVALLEPRLPQALPSDAPPDARVVALSRASERVLRHAGAWPALCGPRLCPYERMRVLARECRAGQRCRAGVRCRGRRRAEPRLHRRESAAAGAHCSGPSPRRADISSPPPCSRCSRRKTRWNSRTTAGTLAARLVVGADGAQSAVRAAAGLTAEDAAYRQTAIVATVATARPHEATAWQRFMKRRHARFPAARRRHELHRLVRRRRARRTAPWRVRRRLRRAARSSLGSRAGGHAARERARLVPAQLAQRRHATSRSASHSSATPPTWCTRSPGRA